LRGDSSAGPLNHVVTNDTATAEKCVEYLKKHNLGRATFIMLDKLGYLESNMAPIDTPEGAPRLFDLIKPKNKRFLPAFYLNLRVRTHAASATCSLVAV
jgi:structural maintenance of chromosome 4